MSKFNLIAFASQKAPLLKSLQQFKEVEEFLPEIK